MCLEYACHTDNIGDENVHHCYSCGLRHLNVLGLIPRKNDYHGYRAQKRRKTLWGVGQGKKS